MESITPLYMLAFEALDVKGDIGSPTTAEVIQALVAMGLVVKCGQSFEVVI